MVYKLFVISLVILSMLIIAHHPVQADCWWTGCQRHDWAIKGCGQYGRAQRGTRNCHAGLEYNCCSDILTTLHEAMRKIARNG